MAVRETGKQRAARIPLDYFRRPDRYSFWRGRLTVAAVAVAGAWLIVGLARGERGKLDYSHGPVAAVHATWEAKCEACHLPLRPRTGDHWLVPLTGRSAAADALCQSCHAGPTHHASELPGDQVGCAACHRDHRGRDASLVRLPDSDCTRCHQYLSSHVSGGQTKFQNVTRFDKDHPPFRSTKEDPGKLKFNHAVHLAPGMQAKWTLGQILDPKEQERYRQQQPKGQQDASSLVQLDCASCHRLDGAEGSKSWPRTAGDFMAPITYKDQCQACHPLTFEAKQPDKSIPHGLQPPQVRDFLWGAYLKDPAAREPLRAARPLPGQAAPEEEKKVRQQIQDKVDQAQKYLYGGNTTCGLCHQGLPDKIIPPAVPTSWFQHAKFRHAAHRAVDCLQCHDGAKTSKTASDVLIPGIQNCLSCHGPVQQQSDGKVTGGARFDCTECHHYHNGDHPLQGAGPLSPRSKATIEQVLSGRPRPD